MHKLVGRVQFVVFEKFTSAYLFQIAQEKSCDYILTIYMKKCKIAYHNYAEAKRSHQGQKVICSNPAFGQNNRVRSKQYIQWYFHILRAQKSSKSGLTVQGIVQSGLLLLGIEITLFCIELPENCVYLNQSKLSSFLMYLITEIMAQ